MELVKGKYKKTELGYIPIEWNIKKLNEIGSFRKGRGIKKDEVVDEGLACIRYGELYTHHNEYIKKINSYVTYETSKTSVTITKGDILFAGSGETKEDIGKCAAFLNEEKTYAGGDVIIYTPKDTDSLFLGFLLNHKIIAKQKAQLGQGDAVVHIYPHNLENVFIPVPLTIEEQTAIAAALYDIDELISGLEKLIKKKKNIKQGAMQELLKPKKGWITKKFGEIIVKIIDNRGKTPPLANSGYPLIEVNAIYSSNKYPIYKEVSKFVSNTTYKKWFRNGHPDIGDILIATVGSVGATVIMKEQKGCIAQNIIAIKISDLYSSEFIFYITKSEKFLRQIKAVLMGAVQPSLKVPHLLNFIVELPQIKIEQEEYSKVLSDMDSEIDLLENKLDKYIMLKQGMMQNLLTGKIRLIDNG